MPPRFRRNSVGWVVAFWPLGLHYGDWFQSNFRATSAPARNPADWANESFALAKAAWVNDGGSVDEQYYRQQIKVVDERLALAGLRLAALLNEVLGHVSPQEFRH